MVPDGTGHNAEAATVGALEVNERTKYDDSRNDRDSELTVDPVRAEPSTETNGPCSTIDAGGTAGDESTALTVGSTHDADCTPNWDSQATATEYVESTLGAWRSTEPVSRAVRPGIVPGFEILDELGRGGMGIVYKAQQEDLKRFVALKMIRSDWHENHEHVARFDIEAEAVARLNHPNIVRIYGIGRAGRARYVVLELLEGGTLKDRLAGTPQPFREAAALLAALARGVSAAHGAGILHRDLKPSNVLFDRAGVPKIVDFGLAKRLEVEEGETHTGQVLGTPSYMAPEQARGWDKDIGPAADIYSLGAILYETLTGRPPLKGSTAMETLKLVQEEEPIPPSRLRPKLPFDLETICLKCIARDPRKRYPDALGMAEDLDRFLDGEPIRARRTPVWERAIRRVKKRPMTAVLIAVAVAAAAIAGGLTARERTFALRRIEHENQRVFGILKEASSELSEAQAALEQQRLEDARVIATGLLGRIEPESDQRIVALRDRALLIDARAKLGLEEQTAIEANRAQFRRFIELRDEASFLDTARFADGVENSIESTCDAARAGLSVFGRAETGDDWTLTPLVPSLSPEERLEITSGFYQLLLILADGISQQPGAAAAQRGDAALRVIRQTERLTGPPTRAYHLRRADYLRLKGDLDAAEHERDQAEQLAPGSAFDFFLIGREAMKRREWKKAITHLEAAIPLQTDFFWAQCLLAICHLQIGEPANARMGLNLCLQKKPDRPWLYMLRAIASGTLAQAESARAGVGAGAADLASQQYQYAEADFRRAFELLGDKTDRADLHYAVLLDRGMMQLLRDDLKSAAADFQEAIKRNDRRYEAFADLGQVYQREGRTEAALEQFAHAIERRPNWAPLYRSRASALLGLKDLSPELRDMTLRELEGAISAVPIDRRDQAARDLAAAIRYESTGEHLVAADWTKQAAILHVEQRLDEALNACDAAIDIAYRYPRAHELRIRVLLDLKQYTDLIRSCDIVLSWAKPSSEFYELRGIAKNAINDFSGAIGDFTRALEVSREPDIARLLRRRGWVYVTSEAFRPAIRDFDSAIRLAPKNADGFIGRGVARARLGLYVDAASDAEFAVKLSEPDGTLTLRTAHIYCEAAAAVRAEPLSRGPKAERLLWRYEDLAVKSVKLAIERTPIAQRASFYHDRVMKDDALLAIRRRIESLEPVLTRTQR
jgi:tetratricopeptide (TPR) repeat protein